MTARSTGTVFITGGTSGIGEGLARAFHARGATVIVSGRDREALARLAADLPGLETVRLDVTDADAVAACAADLKVRFPGLDTVVSNAGVQRVLDFRGRPPTPAEMDVEVDTNVKGLLYVAAAFLPLLRRQPAARLVHVGSALAFVPLVQAPVYSATKAAVHAFTVSLREQLRGGPVQVVELIPPVVATRLHRGQERQPPRAMPLDAFVARSMQALDSGRDELPVGLARVLRAGARVAPRFFLGVINKAR